MKKKFLIISIVILVICVFGIITSYKDSARVRANIEPKYTIKTISYHGDKVTYWGLGYKVIRYVDVSPNEPFESNIGVKYGSWFMDYKINEKKENNLEIINEKQSFEISWDEITKDGVNEKLLFENIDEELLKTISTELRTLVEEEAEAERRNPQIVITEGWGRVFKSERYKKVLALGKPAMKPLYLIVYKSPNAGAYEYLCARILYELSGCDFDWVNSKDFLEKFNNQILNKN